MTDCYKEDNMIDFIWTYAQLSVQFDRYLSKTQRKEFLPNSAVATSPHCESTRETSVRSDH